MVWTPTVCQRRTEGKNGRFRFIYSVIMNSVDTVRQHFIEVPEVNGESISIKVEDVMRIYFSNGFLHSLIKRRKSRVLYIILAWLIHWERV